MINVKNINRIKNEINNQIIVAATKYVDSSDIRLLYNQGIKNIGENRVESFLSKYDDLKELDIIWHFIGQLQSKKVKKVINKIDYLHSLDRISLADAIEKHRDKQLNCFLEINISGEVTKSGLKMEEVNSFYKKIKKNSIN